MAVILVVCCGAGGATRGYVQAGHTVYGVDLDPGMEADYIKAGGTAFGSFDVLHALSRPKFTRQFDLIHVSPPCQRYSRMSNCRPGVAETYPDLIGPVREALIASGLPFVIENVPGSPLRDPTVLPARAF